MIPKVNLFNATVFRSREMLTKEQLTDPDYALKQLEAMNAGKLNITCSKCHHCR